MREHAEQDALLASSSRFVVVAAGRRSGKTERAKRRLVLRCLSPPDVHIPTFVAAAPTRDQAKRIWWQDLKDMVPQWARNGYPRESDLTIHLRTGAQLMVVGLDKPQRIEGIPLDGIVIDEIAEVKRESWEQSIRPALSTPGRPPGWAWFIGRPKGRGFFYDLYARAGTSAGWESFTWKSDTIVDPEEIAQAKADLDPMTYAQEYEAAWVTFEGLAYYQWDPLEHYRTLTYDADLPLVFCFDFNVDPGVAAVLQEQTLNGEDHPRTCVIGEVHIPRNSNTPAVCRKLAQDWGHHQGDVFYYGDATGGSRQTSQTSGSDWDLVRETLAVTFGDRIHNRVPRRNPAVRDRLNAVNSRLRSTSGAVRFAVDPAKAPHVVKDFEGVTLLEGGSGEIDKRGNEAQGLTHLSDAIGYYIHERYPVKPRLTSIY
jgi:hypothetical protein